MEITLWRLRLRLGSPRCVALGVAFRVAIDLVDEMAQPPPRSVAWTPQDLALDVALVSEDQKHLLLSTKRVAALGRFQWRVDCAVTSSAPEELSTSSAFRLRVALAPSAVPVDPTLVALQQFCVGSQWLPSANALALAVLSDEISIAAAASSVSPTSSRCVRVFAAGPHHLHVLEDYGHAMGAHVWDASVFLSLALLETPSLVASAQSVVELGAGVGLVARVVSFSHHEVIATERRDALALLSTNVQGTRVQTREVVWGAPLPPPPLPAPDVVLAADVLYHWSAHEPLLATLAALGATRVVIAHKRRSAATSAHLDDVLANGVDAQCPNCAFRHWRLERVRSLSATVELLHLTTSRTIMCIDN